MADRICLKFLPFCCYSIGALKKLLSCNEVVQDAAVFNHLFPMGKQRLGLRRLDNVTNAGVIRRTTGKHGWLHWAPRFKSCALSTELNLLPDDKLQALSKLKAFADDNFNVAQTVQDFFERLENTVEKEENVGYKNFLLLPQCFQWTSFLGSLKVGIGLLSVKRPG